MKWNDYKKLLEGVPKILNFYNIKDDDILSFYRQEEYLNDNSDLEYHKDVYLTENFVLIVIQDFNKEEIKIELVLISDIRKEKCNLVFNSKVNSFSQNIVSFKGVNFKNKYFNEVFKRPSRNVSDSLKSNYNNFMKYLVQLIGGTFSEESIDQVDYIF